MPGSRVAHAVGEELVLEALELFGDVVVGPGLEGRDLFLEGLHALAELERLGGDAHAEIELPVLCLVPGRDHTLLVGLGRVREVEAQGRGGGAQRSKARREKQQSFDHESLIALVRLTA